MYSVDPLMHSVISSAIAKHYDQTDVVEYSFTKTTAESPQMYVEIIEEPVSDGARFRYKCEGRSAGCIRGINSTEKKKTFPTIKIHGYKGAAGVVVSCVTKDGPPYFPHPHNLVGKTCTNGVCYKPINNNDMICSFSNLGIQCVKRKDVKDSLAQRKALQVDPFGTGFSHNFEPNKINLNALRLCFQVFIPDANGKLCVPLPPVISAPIFDNKTVSDLTITKLSHYSSPVTGGQDVILLCDQVNKDDIQIVFYEENNKEIVWSADGKFSPHHVHRKAAISFQTPAYKNLNVQQQINCFVHLRRPSDGTIGKPKPFIFTPLRRDPEALVRKRNKFESLHLDKVLQLNNLPTESNSNFPRVIKQAVRSKNYQSSNRNEFNPCFLPGREFCQQASSAIESFNYNENVPVQTLMQKSESLPNVLSSSLQKVDDIIAVASEQVGLGSTQNFSEPAADYALDKLSGLDLGLNSSDLDINLSSITLDSFTESVGLNFSLNLGLYKSPDEKMQFEQSFMESKGT